MSPVCVRHREGWCATRRKRVPDDEPKGGNQRTVCGMYVLFPWGYRRMQPTCSECKARLKRGGR